MFAKELFFQAIQADITKMMEFVKEQVTKTYIEQGHELTGSLAQTMEIDIKLLEDGVKGILWVNEYYKYIDQGVPPESIPYSPGSGASSSEYIKGLIEYFVIRLHMTPDEAERPAFATAKKQKEEGMPLNDGSSPFSATGKRTGFFTRTIQENQLRISGLVSSSFAKGLTAVMNEFNAMIRGKIEIVL